MGAATAGACATAGALALVVGTWAWRRATADAVTRLAAAEGTLTDGTPDGGPPDGTLPGSPALDTADLPPPVARYLALALGVDAAGHRVRRVRHAHVRWAGEFQLRPGGGWSPFSATQDFTARPPGFVWDAEVRMLPIVPVRVRDGYVARAASMHARVGAVVPLVDERGTGPLASSALARWLGEAVWFPTALVPGAGVTWEAVDAASARATVTDGDVRVTATFHFAPTGEPTRMTALRYRDVNGTPELTPFEGRYGPLVAMGGVRVPRDAEVAWLLPQGRFPYWRGRPTAVTYEHEPPAPRHAMP
jgi:hypothetical protein